MTTTKKASSPRRTTKRASPSSKKTGEGKAAGGGQGAMSEQERAISDALAALSPRHRRFVQEYCTNGFNATAAYIAAGYSANGARQSAGRLLTNADIARARDALLVASQMSPEELISRISDDATATMLPFLKIEAAAPGDRIMHRLRLDFSTPEAAAALRWVRKVKIEQTKWGEQITFELVDDQRAKDMLARAHKLFVDRQEVEVTGVAAPKAYIPDNGRGPKKEGVG